VEENIDTIQKNTESLWKDSKEFDLEANPEETKYNVSVTLSEGRTKAQHEDSE
jgi:hypothetical protein